MNIKHSVIWVFLAAILSALILREYEKNLPIVPCEAGKIQQVLLNILRNGAEAMQEWSSRLKESPNHEPSLSNRPSLQSQIILRVKYEATIDMVCIEIEDNGPGMDNETSKRVFEPFFTTKPSGQGTGLGLSVSYFIITENHDGEMSVVSELGRGTRFIIKLPVGKSPSD